VSRCALHTCLATLLAPLRGASVFRCQDNASREIAIGLYVKLLSFIANKEMSMAFDLSVNGTRHTLDADPQTPLLWVIRDHIGLTGTKFSCGIGQCGACTVHVDGQPVRSCSAPTATAIGKKITTIEGLSPDGNHPIQVAWKEFDTPQCGYCQSGMIMSAYALLQKRPNPSDADINTAVTNACRCGSYHRVRQAIHRAADLMNAGKRK
jgi:isoquinoline 1-oxidoreductase subunit alpha